ncbi:hypothetical protein EFK68_03900 [Pseudomonas aeruginosa]|jgi:hypothetical protein|uniref:hypothetical protein n=1 Tax=Pseudomonas aeruginosa TaxID=287 RepID=UPI00093B13B0|nr:hypothetical protein [Pseudomonas aeruginosa]EKF7416918.1 hypothetical protein [Pseudomonas aeruginosa]EKW9641039.1 hypothetical protein [Pseudomonas aeruginosa]NRC34143.1 hypothetical protein [Pseudomonas aeruginosa]RNF58521.1 hypothetical protein EFK68_03900 [Pseudomonas aeruginosa]HCA5866547.1 hypothetical protein [Pseudomonas aeruginosa]
MSQSSNLSVRYIAALQQLPQFHCVTPTASTVTHVLTGVRISPLGDLQDADDASGLLEVEFPGGNKVEVIGAMYMQLALKEAAEIEISTSPSDFGIRESKYSPVQQRIAELAEHLNRKHSLQD